MLRGGVKAIRKTADDLFKVNDLHFTHPNDDIANIMMNKGNKPLNHPVEIWGIKDKLIVTDGVGSTTRRIAAGYDDVPGTLQFNIPDISKLSKAEQKVVNKWYDSSIKIDVDETRKAINKYNGEK